MKPLSHDINIIIKRIFDKQHPLLGKIVVNWSKIVGPKFNIKANPLKISSIKKKGQLINVLHVQVENSSIDLEISFYQQIIIERISIYLGFKAIHSLRTTVYTTRIS